MLRLHKTNDKDRLRIWIRLYSMCFALGLFFWLSIGHVQTALASTAVAVPVKHAEHDMSFSGPERVVIIGSSVADGWKDDKGGYLHRAFRALARLDHVHFTLVNHAIPGLGALRLNAYVPGWISSANAQMTVIAWGGLDDAHDHTPLPLFRSMIQQEIGAALADHTVVCLITPPISRASYTQYRIQQPEYLDAEMQVARDFHSPNVFVFDVFDAMRRYLATHGQTYVPYMADGWHPNALGHKLAGELLLHEMLGKFGTDPVLFTTTGSLDPTDTGEKSPTSNS